MSCSKPRRLPGPRSSWSRQRMETASECWRRSRRPFSEGIVQLDDSHVRFAHPLLASLSYGQAPVWKRRAVHRTLADVVTDSEERARHLGLAADGPDAAVASELETAAEQAAQRGAPPAAAELCELAAELTPDDPALARQRRVRAATYHRLAGNGEIAAAILEQLLTEVPSGVERSDVFLSWQDFQRPILPTTLELSDEALAEAADDDARSSRILAVRAWSHFLERRRHARHCRCPHGSGEGRARWRCRAHAGGDRTGGPAGDVGGRDHTGLARAGRGTGGAPRACPRLSDEPKRVTRPPDDPSGRDPATLA